MTIISVIVATRNRVESLHDALHSISHQTVTDFDVLVTDDGSSEEVISINKSICLQLGERFKFIDPSSPSCRGSGPSGARNRGARASKSKYLAFLDDDDQYLNTNFLSLAVSTLEKFNGDLFLGSVRGVKDGSEYQPKWAVPQKILRRLLSGADDRFPFCVQEQHFRAIAQPYILHPGQMVISKELFDRIGGFFEGLWSNSEDRNLMLRLLDQANGVYAWLEPCLLYRIPTNDSISLTENNELHILQRILSGEHALLHCRRPSIRVAARSGVAWSLREYAYAQLAKGYYKDAGLFAIQSLVAFPSIGSSLFVSRFILELAKMRLSGFGR